MKTWPIGIAHVFMSFKLGDLHRAICRLYHRVVAAKRLEPLDPLDCLISWYITGIGSSEAMARRDGEYIQAYKEMIISVSRELGVEPAVIAGIISRETRGGTAINQTGGWGDHGNAFGLMQVSYFTIAMMVYMHMMS